MSRGSKLMYPDIESPKKVTDIIKSPRIKNIFAFLGSFVLVCQAMITYIIPIENKLKDAK